MTAMKVASWIIIAFLAASYGCILYLVRNPDVSQSYRAYYIDGTTTISPAEFRDLRPYMAGTYISHEGSNSLLFEGWSGPEMNHRWSKRERAKLVFIPSDPGSFTGTLVLEAFYNGAQHVEVSVNGVPVGSFDGWRKKTRNVLSFDPRLLIAGRQNEIQFYFPDARFPMRGDPRLLAMALTRVMIQ